MAEHKGFFLYLDQFPPIRSLTREQKGILLEAMFAFNNNEEVDTGDPVVAMAFAFFRQSFERDKERYEAKCKVLQGNALKGKKRQLHASSGKCGQIDTKQYQENTKNKKNTKTKKEYSASASPDAARTLPLPDTFLPDEDQSLSSPGGCYLTKKKRKLTGRRLQSFNRFWAAFAYSKGKAEAADAWLDIPTLTDSLVAFIVAAAEKEAANRPHLVTKGQTPKWAQGWLSARRWEDGEYAAPLEKTLDELLQEQGTVQ